MDEPLVSMAMAVRLAGRVVRRVLVLVMRIMHMSVGVLHLLMNVFVLMALGEMEPHASRHACGTEHECACRSLAQPDQRDAGADKRSE